jgi:hypothetical protein
MTATTYAPTHHRVLTKAQTENFITALDNAKHTGDAEKAVESAINTLLTQGLRSIYNAAPKTVYNIGSVHTDGYMTVGPNNGVYALLVESKRDMAFSASKNDVAEVLTQVCAYIRAISAQGALVPAVSVICDIDEVFAIPTTLLLRYIENDNYQWDTYPPSSMHNDAELMAALIKDSNIRPYIHDIHAEFDADMFIWAVDAMGNNQPPIKVPVDAQLIEHVFTRFKMEVLGTDATGLKNKDEIALFLDILRGSDDVYAHPKQPNTLVWNTTHITLDTYRFERFWSQYVTGDYTLKQLKSLTQMADSLIEEADRRFNGDYWTPPIWVDKSHEYIEAVLGKDWKTRYVVWDPAAGALNLTRDYRFNELYCSTLFQEELDIAQDYNTEAVKFQYDFLNDDMVLHEDGMDADKALELARAGKLKMPSGLVEALAENKPIVFYANPPYGQAASPDGKKHKPGVAATAITDFMEGFGHAKSELYTQFIWRTKELAKLFNYTENFHIYYFSSAKFIPSPNFGKFVHKFTNEFHFNNGFMMNAGEFNGTSSAWSVVFSHFEIGGTNQRKFNYAVLKSNKDLSIGTLTNWTGRVVSKGETLNDWLKESLIPKEKKKSYPLTKNGFDTPTAKTISCVPVAEAFGYMHNKGCNVQQSERYVGLYTMGYADAHGRDITNDNIDRIAVTFSIRRAVYEKFAEDKQLWFHWEDIFTRPPEDLLTPEFIADCVVYSLFDKKSKQTSLRNYEYKGQTYRVENQFFPFAKKAIVELAEQHGNMAVQVDADTDTDRLVYTWLEDHKDNISTEAQALLDLVWEIIKVSFAKRDTFATIQPRYQTNSWDAGWAQINAQVFGNNRIDNAVYDGYYDRFRNTRRALGNKIAHVAMNAGVI